MFGPDESIPEEFEEKDIMPIKPFEIEKSSFGSEYSVFLPVTLHGYDLWKSNPKFSKGIFASKEDAQKEIIKYKKYF